VVIELVTAVTTRSARSSSWRTAPGAAGDDHGDGDAPSLTSRERLNVDDHVPWTCGRHGIKDIRIESSNSSPSSQIDGSIPHPVSSTASSKRNWLASAACCSAFRMSSAFIPEQDFFLGEVVVITVGKPRRYGISCTDRPSKRAEGFTAVTRRIPRGVPEYCWRTVSRVSVPAESLRNSPHARPVSAHLEPPPRANSKAHVLAGRSVPDRHAGEAGPAVVRQPGGCRTSTRCPPGGFPFVLTAPVRRPVRGDRPSEMRLESRRSALRMARTIPGEHPAPRRATSTSPVQGIAP